MDAADKLDQRCARGRCLRESAAEDRVRQQDAKTGTRVGLQQEEDRLALCQGLLGAQRRQDSVVDRVVQEEDLGRFYEDARQRQQPVIDQEFHSCACSIAESRYQRSNTEEPHNAHGGRDDPRGEVIDQHLEPGLDPAFPDLVEFLHDESGQRAHDHGPNEHRDIRTHDDTHGGCGADYAATDTVNHFATGVTDQQRQQVGNHRFNQCPQGLIRKEAVRNEQGGDDSPGNERPDIGHNHAGEERPEFLDADPQTGAGRRFCFCGH